MTDATYLADAALRAFKRRQELGQLALEDSHDSTDHQEAIRRLAEQRAPALQNTKQTANKQGLFYSGQLGKRLGEVERDFTRQEGDQGRDYDRRRAAREAARRAIESGAPLEEAAAAAAAADRQIERDAERADENALAENAAPTAAPAAPRAVAARPRPAVKPKKPAATFRGRPGPAAANLARPRRPAVRR